MVRNKKGSMFADVIFAILMFISLVTVFSMVAKTKSEANDGFDTNIVGNYHAEYGKFRLFTDLAFQKQIKGVRIAQRYETACASNDKYLIYYKDKISERDCSSKIISEIVDLYRIDNIMEKSPYKEYSFELILQQKGDDVFLDVYSQKPFTIEADDFERATSLELTYKLPEDVADHVKLVHQELPIKFAAIKMDLLRSTRISEAGAVIDDKYEDISLDIKLQGDGKFGVLIRDILAGYSYYEVFSHGNWAESLEAS